jgi:hypothetical protein
VLVLLLGSAACVLLPLMVPVVEDDNRKLSSTPLLKLSAGAFPAATAAAAAEALPVVYSPPALTVLTNG